VNASPAPVAAPATATGTVILNRHNTHRVLRGHCWVYVTEVERVAECDGERRASVRRP